MTLLEMLARYQTALRSHGRHEAFVVLQDCMMGMEGTEGLVDHIEACFDDNGKPVDALGEQMAISFV